MDDSKIVDLFFKRDENAIRCTSEKYGYRLRKIADNIVHDKRISEECENDTYLKAWNTIPPHEPRTYLFSYLAKIIRNLAIDFCKRESRQKRSAVFADLSDEAEECIPVPSGVESEYDAVALSRVISDFLKTISVEKRNIFIRRYWFFDSVADISRRFSISEGKVKTVLFRTRKELKTWLEREGYNI